MKKLFLILVLAMVCTVVASAQTDSSRTYTHTAKFEKLRSKAGDIIGTSDIKKIEKFKKSVNKHIASFPQEEGVAKAILGSTGIIRGSIKQTIQRPS